MPGVAASVVCDARIIAATDQGLTLIHFSAHPEPLWLTKQFKHPAIPPESAYVESKSGQV
jgi:hypothetical protein